MRMTHFLWPITIREVPLGNTFHNVVACEVLFEFSFHLSIYIIICIT